mgnify:CR=1 FL=1
MVNEFKAIISRCIEDLSKKDSLREELIKLSREIIRESSTVIHLLHRGEFEEAKATLDELMKLVEEMRNKCEDFPEMLYAGFVLDSLAEYVEAKVFYCILTGENIPSIDEMRVPVQSLLLGLGDVIGELRRAIIIFLIKDDLEVARRLLDTMSELVDSLSKVHFPDALVPGLRRKCDIGRRLLDETMADYLRALERKRLESYVSKIL